VRNTEKILLLLCTTLLAAGCGRGPDQAQQPPADTTVAVDVFAEAPLIRVGYVGHDHHSAVYVAALRGERMNAQYGIYLAPLREGELYALVENGVKVAEVEFFRATGGGSVVPTSMAAGEFDLGFGGVAAFISSTDAGTGIAIVSPLHTGGDMLVVSPDNETAVDWATFTDWVRNGTEPVYVGFKNPQAVAKNIFEAAEFCTCNYHPTHPGIHRKAC
jgi:ABC-type nitrate/sulfonate/bicarbonate transport system substrate-binding protein